MTIFLKQHTIPRTFSGSDLSGFNVAIPRDLRYTNIFYKSLNYDCLYDSNDLDKLLDDRGSFKLVNYFLKSLVFAIFLNITSRNAICVF